MLFFFIILEFHFSAFRTELRLAPLTLVSLGSLLLTASVGHAVQTDQRSHDKERANTGAHSAAGANGV